jgi:thymidine phosphorylase
LCSYEHDIGFILDLGIDPGDMDFSVLERFAHRFKDIFGKMVAALGGPVDFIENYDNYLEKADIVRPVYANKKGTVESMDTRAIGMAVVAMGGGRRKPTDSIDYAVGLTDFIALGEEVNEQRPLAVVHVRNEAQFEEAQKVLREAIRIGNGKPESKQMVFEKIRLEDLA